MKLITHVEYHTRWGEELFLRAGAKIYPMEYGAGGIWTAVICRLRPDPAFEYRYEVHSGGLCRRTEWKSHVIALPDGSREPVEVKDSWNDVPEGHPFDTSPFADGVFAGIPGRRWKAAGTAIPVFSLRSESDFGIGEFHDLKLLADWAAATGQKIIQLLPVNDTAMTGTWEDSYPYNANSSFALHPQFIHLPDAGVEEDEEYLRLQAGLNSLPEVDYEKVNLEKQRLLRIAFDRTGPHILRTGAYKAFVEENREWLLPYAAYRALAEEHGTADFRKWEPRRKPRKKEMDYHCFVQYHLHIQLSDARNYARSKGVVFKGDLPIGVSRTSADAWVDRRLFNMGSQAGAPPDAFSAEGQNWGFPTYNWEEMAKDGYAWWKSRLKTMSQYFDAFRIDHILGFFRIWEIPSDAVHGLLGHFNPAMPYSSEELSRLGFDMSSGRYSQPYIDDFLIDGVFGEYAAEVKKKCVKVGRLRSMYASQKKVAEAFPGRDGKSVALRSGLMHIIDNVLFVEDPVKKGFWHPRIAAQYTYSYSLLDEYRRRAFNRLYDDFFYRRHNAFWKDSAMRKLPSLLTATGMLACGEDLGMIPDCVPEVMREYSILSLEIQRMSKQPYENFADTSRYPYYSVCSTSTHDMNPIRAWWEEDRDMTDKFWHEVLGEQGNAPAVCEPQICRRIVKMHLDSPSMLAILPLQDWLSMDGDLRLEDPSAERINVPAVARYYWRYRMHLTLEDLLSQSGFNAMVKEMVTSSGR